MKKYLFIVLALCILVTFTGCNWFMELLNIGSAELSVDSVVVYEESGRVSSVQLSINNYGTRDVEDTEGLYVIVFSVDLDIDINSDTVIYSEQIYIESDDWYENTIYWDSIATYIDNNNVLVPLQEGYVGVIVNPYGSVEEDDGDWDNSTQSTSLTSVPSSDGYEDDDDGLSAADIEAAGWSITRAIFTNGDQDWFWFDVNSGPTGYEIETGAVGEAVVDTYIEIYDSFVTFIDGDDDSGTGTLSYYNLVGPSVERHFIKVTGTGTNSLGLYTLTITPYY